MREIKFRAWDKIWKVMTTTATLQHVADGFLGLTNGNIVMQYTGLKDKNGVEIYEGDLLQNKHGRIGKVVWHDCSASFDTDFVKDTSLDMTINDKSYGFKNSYWPILIEVIGNIYESPELLN